MICDEAEGCLRYVREFPQSMSDFKPGGCNNETLCVLVLLAKGGMSAFSMGRRVSY